MSQMPTDLPASPTPHVAWAATLGGDGAGPRVRPRRSLSWRLLWFTLAVMAATEAMLFVPAMQRERQEWLDQRLVAAQIAVQALPSTTATGLRPPPLPGQAQAVAFDRATREELLRLAGVASIRLQEPGRPMVVLAPIGQLHAAALLDMRVETTWSRLRATLQSLTRSGDRMLLVMAPSPKRPQAILSIVLNEGALDTHLRRAAGEVALHGLAVAFPTGLLVYFSLFFLLVLPMRRLIDSIAAFRADPEHAAPLIEPRRWPLAAAEISVAGQELSAMQRELRAALWRNARLAALGTAVAKVSHDLRGILSPALLTAERLQANDDALVRRAGDTMVRTVERATDLVKSTLEFAREAPALPARASLKLREVADEVAEQVRIAQPATSVEIGFGEDVCVQADRVGLIRALANLVRNAAEAGATRVFLTARQEAETVVVTIADNGPGLPEVVRRRLFQPFVTSGKPGGTGLGLAITRDLVRAQGGDVALVHSGADGSEFRVTLECGS